MDILFKLDQAEVHSSSLSERPSCPPLWQVGTVVVVVGIAKGKVQAQAENRTELRQRTKGAVGSWRIHPRIL